MMKSSSGTLLSHCGSLSIGPSIFTRAGLRSASPLIFAQSVISPQYRGGASAAATYEKILPGVSHPDRIAASARSSRRPSPVTGSGRSWSHRITAAGINGRGASAVLDNSASNAASCTAKDLHPEGEPELGDGDGRSMTVKGRHLTGLKLPEAVERFNSGKCVHAQQLRIRGK